MNAPAASASATLGSIVAAIERHPRLAIAVSGGVDSLTLAHIATRHARTVATMYHATGPAVPRAARERVEAHAAANGWRLVVIDAQELADPRYRANPVDRCYYCKTNLYARIAEATADTIASGTNRDDLGDYRPGLRAAAERAVVHPYVETGIGKEGIHALARHLRLADIERLPAQPCLASRVETGIAIDPADLAFIDGMERALAARLGSEATLRCRVTHDGVVVELGAAEVARDAAVATEIATARCALAGRRLAGVRPYVRGAAFLHGT